MNNKRLTITNEKVYLAIQEDTTYTYNLDSFYLDLTLLELLETLESIQISYTDENNIDWGTLIIDDYNMGTIDKDTKALSKAIVRTVIQMLE